MDDEKPKIAESEEWGGITVQVPLSTRKLFNETAMKEGIKSAEASFRLIEAFIDNPAIIRGKVEIPDASHKKSSHTDVRREPFDDETLTKFQKVGLLGIIEDIDHQDLSSYLSTPKNLTVCVKNPTRFLGLYSHTLQLYLRIGRSGCNTTIYFPGVLDNEGGWRPTPENSYAINDFISLIQTKFQKTEAHCDQFSIFGTTDIENLSNVTIISDGIIVQTPYSPAPTFPLNFAFKWKHLLEDSAANPFSFGSSLAIFHFSLRNKFYPVFNFVSKFDTPLFPVSTSDGESG